MSKAKLSDVLKCFESKPEWTLDELCDELGSSLKTTRHAIKLLVDSNFLEAIPVPPTAIWDHKDLSEAVQYRLTLYGRP